MQNKFSFNFSDDILLQKLYILEFWCEILLMQIRFFDVFIILILVLNVAVVDSRVCVYVRC